MLKRLNISNYFNNNDKRLIKILFLRILYAYKILEARIFTVKIVVII